MSGARLGFTFVTRLSIYVADAITKDVRNMKRFRECCCLPVAEAYLWLESKHIKNRSGQMPSHPAHEGTRQDKIELGAQIVGVAVVRAYMLSMSGLFYLIWKSNKEQRALRHESLEYEARRIKNQLREKFLSCQERALVIRHLEGTARALTHALEQDIRKLREGTEEEREERERMKQFSIFQIVVKCFKDILHKCV